MAFELKLDLSRHCIETEIKRQHNRAVSDYFRAAPAARQQLEEIIEQTRQLLESADFKQLRSTYPALAGHCETNAILTQEKGRSVIIVDGAVIQPQPPDHK